MYFELLYISSYSVKVQLTTLLILLLLSYLHRGVRLILACVATFYLAFVWFVPLVGWAYYLFKGIAMFGFYMYYFQMGLRFLRSVGWMVHDTLDYVLEKLEQEEQQQEGRRRRGRRRRGGG